MAENQPGDGSNNPFGNGGGSAGGSMGQGNNFTANPSGQPGRTGGGQPESYGQSRVQRQGEDPDISQAEIPEGGKDLQADNVQAPGETPVGTGSVGNSRRPFKALHNPSTSEY